MKLFILSFLLQVAFAVPSDTECGLPRLGMACSTWKPGWSLRINLPESLPCNFTLFTNIDNRTVPYILDYFNPYDQHFPYPHSVFAAEEKGFRITFFLTGGKLATNITPTKSGSEEQFPESLMHGTDDSTFAQLVQLWSTEDPGVADLVRPEFIEAKCLGQTMAWALVPPIKRTFAVSPYGLGPGGELYIDTIDGGRVSTNYMNTTKIDLAISFLH